MKSDTTQQGNEFHQSVRKSERPKKIENSTSSEGRQTISIHTVIPN